MNNLLITGSSRGIGRSVFETTDKSLYSNIILLDKNEITSENNQEMSFKCDITNQDEVENIFKLLERKGILITHAVNCAGIPGPSKTFHETSVEDFDKVINVNLRGTFIMLKNQIDHMFKAKKGKIVNIASVLGSCGLEGSAPYGSTKAGIVSLTKHLAIEYAQKNISINCISPGGVDTDLILDLKNTIGIKSLESIHPVKRIATPDEIAIYVKFLLEKATSFMTGSEIFIDGGYSAK